MGEDVISNYFEMAAKFNFFMNHSKYFMCEYH